MLKRAGRILLGLFIVLLVLLSGFTIFIKTAHAVSVENPFPIATTAGSEGAIGAAFDGTNYLIGIQGDTVAHNNVTAQLVSQSGALVGSRISVGRTGGAPSVAFDGTNYLMVWSDDAQWPGIPNRPYDILYGQLVGKSGQLVGSPFPIGQSYNDGGPIIFDGTNYFVVWEKRSRQSSADAADVYGQFITPSGTLLGSAIPVSTAIHGQRSPGMAFDGTNILVVWPDGRSQSACYVDTQGTHCLESDIYGQFVTKSSTGAAGSLSGGNFLISASSLPRDQSGIGIAFDGTNYFMVFLEETTLPNACTSGGCKWNIFGQLVSSTGTAVGGPVNIRTQGNQFFPTIGFDGTQYLVAWSDSTNDANGNGKCDAGEGTCWDAYGQLISKSGTLAGTAFTIDNNADNQLVACSGPAVSGKLFCLINTGFDFSTNVFGDVYGAFLDASGSSACTYTLSPVADGFASTSALGSITVTPSLSSCNWTSVSNDSWVSIISGNSGTGSGPVAYSISDNTTGIHRKGTLTIGGQTVTIRQAKSVFLDDPNNYASPYIYSIYVENITVGCGTNVYCPTSNVTRGQMAAFIIRSLYGESFTYTINPYYTDVPSDHIFFKYVQRLKDLGITTTTGRYMESDVVTREQMAAFIIRAKYGETFTYTTTPYYTDVPSTSIFFKYVQRLKDDATTTMTGTYNASGNVGRDQMAAFLSRAFLGMK